MLLTMQEKTTIEVMQEVMDGRIEAVDAGRVLNRSVRQIYRLLKLTKTIGWAALSFLFDGVAYADNCGNLSDCFHTIGAATAAAVGIAVTVIVGSLLDFLGWDTQAETSISPSWTAIDPAADALVQDPKVRAEMERAFTASHDNLRPDADVREQGGWIVRLPTGALEVVRWPEGESGSITPSDRPDNAVAHFHTHPYGNDVGIVHEPSDRDLSFTRRHNIPGFTIDRTSIFRIDLFNETRYRDLILR